MELYGYFRSSTSYRVRIALNFKGLDYVQHGVNLKDGDHLQSPYRQVNPQGAVPTLIDDGLKLTQSTAIIEYLEEKYPDPPMLPEDLAARAYCRQVAQVVGSDIHPLDNLRVLKYLVRELGVDEEAKMTWYRRWVDKGFKTIERLMRESEHHTGKFVCGDAPTLADMYLVPQIYNAKRFDCPLDNFPLIREVDEACSQHPAFIKAIPENQPDAPEELKQALQQ